MQSKVIFIHANVFIKVMILNEFLSDIIQGSIHNFAIFSGVYFCDITIPEAFVVPVEPFDVIIASLVFDVVAITDKMYISSLTNVLQYLKVKSSN